MPVIRYLENNNVSHQERKNQIRNVFFFLIYPKILMNLRNILNFFFK